MHANSAVTANVQVATIGSAEDSFLTNARPNLTELGNASNAALLAIGLSACNSLGAGVSKDEYRAGLLKSNPSQEVAFDHLAIASAATLYLCPQRR